MAQNDSANNKLQKADKTFVTQNSTDSVYYSILLLNNVSQQKINVGDFVLIKMLGGKLQKHKVTSIYNGSFIVDSTFLVYPDHICLIGKAKSKVAKYISGGIITATGFILSRYFLKENYDFAFDNIIWNMAFDNELPVELFLSTALVVTGVYILVSRINAYNISKGDKILFIQQYYK